MVGHAMSVMKMFGRDKKNSDERYVHFGLRGVAVLLLLATLAAFVTPSVQAAQRDDSQQQQGTRYHYANVAESVPGGSSEKLLIMYNEFMGPDGPGSAIKSTPDGKLSSEDYAKLKDFVQKLYTEAGKGGGSAHKKVALLISNKLDESATSKTFNEGGYEHRQIGDDMSVLMAQARDRMIEEVVIDVLKAKGWEVARSDSGNPKSGMRSDLDQTFYVFKRDPESGALVRDETLDSDFIRAFKDTWAGRFQGLDLDMLDVVSIEGRNRFPDPRAFASHEFGKAYLGTIAKLRNIEGAYTTYGAVLQQVQRRQLSALTDPQNKRVWQQYGKTGEGADGEIDKIQNPDFDLATRSIFYATPELLPDSAFGAAVANYFELQHYMNAKKFNTKYHLRTFDDSLFSRFLFENYGRMKDKVDYLDMKKNQRNIYGSEMLKRLFPGGTPDAVAKRKAHFLAMEVSRDMRLEHVAETPEDMMKVDAYKKHGSVPEAEFGKKRLMFSDLAEHMFGEKYKPNETGPLAEKRLKSQIEAAEAYHRKLASEFCLESIHNTGVDNFKLLANPDLADRCRYLLDVEPGKWEATKANLVESSKITLLFAVYDLGMVDGARMLRRFDVEVPGNRWQLFKLYFEGQFMPIRAAIADPEAYVRTLKPRLNNLVEGVRMHVLGQLGFEHVGEAEVIDGILAEQQLVWNWRNVAKSMFWDVGTIGSATQIAETYFVSKGDMKVVMEKVLDEIYLAVPIIGQLENLRRGDAVNAGMMGLVLYYPAVGQVMVAYNIGKSFYTIYKVEFAMPVQGNIEDAIYRGFAGPETMAFGEIGKPPPDMNNIDYTRLANFEGQLLDAKPATPTPPNTRDASVLEQWHKEREELYKPYLKLKARIMPHILRLRRKKMVFEQFRDGSWSGGYFTGGGAVEEQKWMSVSLLDAVEPAYAFLPGGVVDFTVDYEPERAKARRKQLKLIIDNSDDIKAQVEASAERAELDLKEKRYERAQNYFEQAKKNKELAYRIKRDSLFRWCQKNRINIDKYVDEFVSSRGERLFRELVAIDLEESYDVSGTDGAGAFTGSDFTGAVDRLNRLSETTVENLKKRMRADWERSRDLTRVYLRNETGRGDTNKKNLEKAKDLFTNEAFGLLVDKLKDDQKFKDYLNALRFSAIKRIPPQIKATIFKITKEDEQFRNGPSGQIITENFELNTAVDIFADETLYLRPYRTETTVLKGASGGNVTLAEQTKQAVAELRSEHADELSKGEGIIAVVSVYASKLANVDGALPKTLEGLPGFEGGRAKSGEVLMGQQVGFVPVNPVKINVEPIRIVVKDAADNTIDPQPGVVTVDGNEAKISAGEYWTTHQFTKYGEKIEILVNYKLPDGTELGGRAELSVNDIENWLIPQPPKDPIVIKLPMFSPGSFRLKGVVTAEAPDPNSPYPGYVSIHNDYLEIDEGTRIAGGQVLKNFIERAAETFFGPDDEGPQDGSFDIPVQVPVKASDSISLTFEGETERHFFSAIKSVGVPQTTGTINFGSVAMKVDRSPTRVPEWNSQSPPDYKAYAGELRSAGLRGKPKLGPPPPEGQLQHKLSHTEPGAGTLVPKGTEVAVILHGKYARRVPNVVGLKIDEAEEYLEDQGFTVKETTGQSAPSKQKEFTVSSQSVRPGTEHLPDVPITVVVYSQFVPNLVVPDLAGKDEEEAAKAIKKAQLTLTVVDRDKKAQNQKDRGAVYQQEPRAGTRVGEGERIRVWVYAGGKGPDEGPSGPYYAALQMYSLEPKQGASAPQKLADRREDETNEEYVKRAVAFIDTVPLGLLETKPMAVDEFLLAIHVSNEALKRYPRSMFAEGQKLSVGAIFEGEDEDSGERMKFAGGLLLMVLGTYNQMSEVTQAYPILTQNEKLDIKAFSTADGINRSEVENVSFTLGPFSKGWTDKDKREFLRLAVYIGTYSPCYVATVAYENPLAREVNVLRDFRDSVLMQTEAGRHLVELYYMHGPRLAMAVADNPQLERAIKAGLDATVWCLEHTDTDNVYVRAGLNGVIAQLDTILAAILPERNSAAKKLQEALLRHQKIRTQMEHQAGSNK